MRAITDRARSIYQLYDYLDVQALAKQDAYIRGAEDQLNIDIEKACKWLKAYDKTFTETPSMLEDFIKAMEK